MNRVQVKEALYNAAKELGYQPLILSEKELQDSLETLPTMWIQPLKLKEIEGCRNGRITYSIKVACLEFAGNESPENLCDIRAKMEQNLMELLSITSLDSVVITVDNITISPCAKPFTKHGELAIIAEADIITHFGE